MRKHERQLFIHISVGGNPKPYKSKQVAWQLNKHLGKDGPEKLYYYTVKILQPEKMDRTFIREHLVN